MVELSSRSPVFALGVSAANSGAVNGPLIQAAIDAAFALGGGNIYLPRGVILSTPLRRKNNVVLNGEGKGVTTLKLADAANADFVTDAGFSSYADDVSRSYAWHSSTTARNAQSYDTGQYVMVAASSTDFDTATWWRANSDDATTNAQWDAVDPVVGCVGGGLRGLTIDGNASGQSGSYRAGALYGIDTLLEDVSFENAATALHAEVPGGVYSTQVGRNLQWSMRGLEFRKFTVCGFVDNAQSDGNVYDVMAYADDDVVPTNGLIHIKAKAAGQKIVGLHGWGGAAGTVGLTVDAAGVTISASDMERPIQVNSDRFRYDGRVYRANNAAAIAGPAFEFADSIAAMVIDANVAHFQYGYKQNGSPGLGNSIAISHYSEAASSARIDPTGAAGDSTQSEYEYRPNFASGNRLAILGVPGTMRASVVRRNAVSAAYAASITRDIRDGDFIVVGALTGDVTINNPTNLLSGHEITFSFLQDATGSRAITWGSTFVGGPTAGGAASTRRVCSFKYDGTKLVLVGDTGSWV